MTPNHDPTGGDRPDCSEPDCADAAAFWRYDADTEAWLPVCTRHARHAHPSLELRAWLEGGYLNPVEVGRPAGPPPDPPTRRAEAFRELVETAMGWTE